MENLNINKNITINADDSVFKNDSARAGLYMKNTLIDYILHKNILEGFDNVSLLIVIIICIYIIYIFYKMFQEILKQRNILRDGIQNIDNLSENHNLGDDDCPICHEQVLNAVELDCSHKYCAKCIMEYYKTTQPNLACPLCRKSIRLIHILNYNRSEEVREYMEMIVIFNHDHLNGYNYVKIY